MADENWQTKTKLKATPGKSKEKTMKLATDPKMIDDKATGPPKVEVKTAERDGALIVGIVGTEDNKDFYAQMYETTGVKDISLARFIIDQAALVISAKDDYITTEDANKVLNLIHEIRPQNGLESLLTTQMINTHMLANEMMYRASFPKQTPGGVDRNINRATKLMRVFNAQIDTLQKLRGKGQHKMTVEHVHVYEGGQAVVGDINQGGVNEK
jgi:hypothetical protein